MDFITDRTEEDVLLGREKGFYTVNDLNRVESNVEELAKMAVDISAHFSPVTKTDWSRSDGLMNETQANRYIKNVHGIATACGIKSFAPSKMQNLNFTGANNIEKTLEMVYNRIKAITSTFKYSGEFFAGEE